MYAAILTLAVDSIGKGVDQPLFDLIPLALETQARRVAVAAAAKGLSGPRNVDTSFRTQAAPEAVRCHFTNVSSGDNFPCRKGNVYNPLLSPSIARLNRPFKRSDAA